MESHLDLESLCIFGAHLPRRLPPPPVACAAPLDERVLQAVSRAVADARPPVAVALSGGVDSTVVAAALSRIGLRPRAFALDTGRAVDEGRAAAAALGLPFEVIPLPPGGIRGTSPLEVVSALRQPTHSGAPFGFLPLYAALAARGIGTVFTGDGADEVFAGHAYHRRPPDRWDPAVWPTWRAVRALGIDTALVAGRGAPWGESPAARLVAEEVASLPPTPAGSAERLRWLDVRLRQDAQCVSLQRALATHCGLDYRAPLADPAVTSAALALAPRPRQPKWPLVDLARRWLGAPWRREKQPMHTPTGGRPLGPGWRRWLAPEVVDRHRLFAPAEVARAVEGIDPAAPWLPRSVVVVATTHAGLEAGVFTRAQFRGASSSK